MRRARGPGLPAMALALVLVSGCGDDTRPRDASSSPPASSPKATISASASPSASSEPTVVAAGLTLDALRQRVLAAVRDETSVHMAVGNLNPPPPLEIDQEYSTPDGDLEFVLSMEPGRPAISVRRVDGEVYMGTDGKQFERVPAQKLLEAEETPLTAQLRTDVVKDMTALLAGAVKGEFQGGDASLGDGVTRYQLKIDTAAWFRAQSGDMALGLLQAAYPKVITARLWIDAGGLPVRLEVRYREPLNGIEGTGTVRVDYSRWSEPVEVERP